MFRLWTAKAKTADRCQNEISENVVVHIVVVYIIATTICKCLWWYHSQFEISFNKYSCINKKYLRLAFPVNCQ